MSLPSADSLARNAPARVSVVVRRYACNKWLENGARLATQHDVLSRRRYAALRRRGHSHGRALRTVGDRLLSVACTLLEQQTLFDPTYKVPEAAGA
jgi:transposase